MMAMMASSSMRVKPLRSPGGACGLELSHVTGVLCGFRIDSAGKYPTSCNSLHWIAPTEKDAATTSLEKRLWDAADQFRADSGIKAQESFGPILHILVLGLAEARLTAQRAKLEKAGASSRPSKRKPRGVLIR